MLLSNVSFLVIKFVIIEYQNVFLKVLNKIKKKEIVKEVLVDMNKSIIPNFENPLLLSDYLTYYLD